MSELDLVLISTWVNNDCTIGRLNYKEFDCLTLELPWLDNKVGVSCVPAGIYEAEKYYSPKFRKTVILLKGVQGRSFIEIHTGNFTRDIEGCIVVGDSLKYLDGDNILDVSNSVKTFNKLMAMLPDKFLIEITREGI